MKHFCTLVDELLAEKDRINPIPEGTTALIFTPAGADGQEVTITDPKVISALRSAYCWTNQHLHCCLPGEVEATMSVVVRGARRSEEPPGFTLTQTCSATITLSGIACTTFGRMHPPPDPHMKTAVRPESGMDSRSFILIRSPDSSDTKLSLQRQAPSPYHSHHE